MKGIITCVDRPCEYMRKLLVRKGIDVNVLYFIDMVTSTSSHASPEPQSDPNENIVYLNTLFNLETLFMVTQDMLNTVKERIIPLKLYLDLESAPLISKLMFRPTTSFKKIAKKYLI